MALDIIEPVGLRVLIRKDEERRTTKGGIHLPDDAKIPVITGRIVAISAQVENDPDYPLQKYDKVILDPRNVVPVDFEQDNKLFVIPIDDIVAVYRRADATETIDAATEHELQDEPELTFDEDDLEDDDEFEA
ncbi:MAG: co-chaperone GroES [Pirellulales bacterium]|nr:co-chaperone GroES [Pirellulales bacterium]